MKTHRTSGLWLICLTVIIAFVIVTLAGCVDSAQNQQGQVTPAGNQQNENPAPVATKTTAAPAPPKTAQPTSAPVQYNGVITIDPVGDYKTGDTFTITGITSLPVGTNLFWDITPDTGIPPKGIDMNQQRGIMANNQVAKGSGTSNRVSLDVDLKDMPSGKYVVVVVSLKGDPMTVDPSTGTLAGYTYLTVK
ncbi:MAG: hypothetical protein M0R30_13505 [Methanoregula sp.]|jgi:uncharacterized iron-regulated membrane protein|uniref:hypothetical protein n=1 Tax=Methanoregula sp. TaxID=2052170 RepID=UPI0025CE4421|nr:hypothetical protein [Methanoregula sp.]MCK9632642.1 hypothetical protein [Methanoregula sp.]